MKDLLDRKTLLKRRLVSVILGDIMRKAIREKYGASYSPRVLYWVDENSGYGMYRISIATQHENFAQMRKEIPSLIEKFAQEGIDAQTLARMKKPSISAWQQNSKQNKGYTSLLSLMSRKDRPYLQWHGDFVEMMQSITLEEINAEIKQAFIKENRAILTGITVQKKIVSLCIRWVTYTIIVRRFVTKTHLRTSISYNNIADKEFLWKLSSPVKTFITSIHIRKFFRVYPLM